MGGLNDYKPYIFHTLSDFLSQETQEKLFKLAANLAQIYPCQIQIHWCSDNDLNLANLRTHNGNYLAYYRLFFKKFLPKNITKALYLDIDMLVFGDLREIFELDLEGATIGVVRDYYAKRILQPKSATQPPP